LPELPITLFADFTSAASYVTEAALRRVGSGATVRYRAFLEKERAGEDEEVARLATALALPLLGMATPPGTGKAHEASLLARERGLEESFREALYAAYWGEGRDIGRIDVLQDLAAGVGIDPFEMKVALDIDRHRDEVERDLAVADRLGIRRVPVLYLGTGSEAHILIGAQSPDRIATAIRTILGTAT
jgi:predicted DsbA family dithiol-disulfide isomerase